MTKIFMPVDICRSNLRRIVSIRE